MTRTWFITGANRGLGLAFTRAALAEGDRVVATTRDPRTYPLPENDRLVVLPLDVRDSAAVQRAIDRAEELTGGLDIVVNNAGYGLVGALEELTEAQLREQMEVNFFGAMAVSRAAAPYLRARGRGHIVQISTVGAVGSLPLFGAYNASKWALEGGSAALAEELRPFGVHVTLAQLSGFDTDWAGSSMRFATALPDYTGLREAVLGMPDYPDHTATSTDAASADAAPEIAARAILELVDMPNPPLRRIIGPGAHTMVAMALEQRRVDYLEDPEFTWPA